VEAAVADPDRPGTILDHLADVTLVFWLLGRATGPPPLVAALHDERLERVLRMLVDTPVRGFVYEAPESAEAGDARGARVVHEAAERWRIPVEIVNRHPSDWEAWTEAMLGAAGRLAGAGRT
jgi:hypothetical protein